MHLYICHYKTQHTIKRICTARYRIPYTRIVVGYSHNNSRSNSIQQRWSLNSAKCFCWANGIFLFVVPRVLHLYLNRIHPSTLPDPIGRVKSFFCFLSKGFAYLVCSYRVRRSKTCCSDLVSCDGRRFKKKNYFNSRLHKHNNRPLIDYRIILP